MRGWRGRGARPRARRPVAGAVCALLAGIVVAMAAPGALAGGGSLAWNEEGSTYARFGANQYVTIDTGRIDFACDTFAPTADVYIVKSGVLPGQDLTDVSGAPNTVDGATGGLFIDETIGVTQPSGTLGPGLYAVVYDECQDGKYDAATDELFDPAFRVTLPATLPPIDGAVHALKQQAAVEELKWLAVLLSYDGITAMKKAYECLDAGPIACFEKWVVDKLSDTAKDQAREALGLTDPIEAARDRVQDTINHYEGIRKDPPDAAFEQLTTLPAVGAVPVDAADPLLAQMALLGRQAAQEAAETTALLHALERYQGAAQAGDGTWGLVQARALAQDARLLAGQTTRTQAQIARLSAALGPQVAAIDTDAPALVAEDERIATNGFSAHETDALREVGVTGSQLDALRRTIAGLPQDTHPAASLADALTELDAASVETRQTLLQLAADVDGIAAAIAADANTTDDLPRADPGGPYTGTAGAPIALDASGSRAAAGTIARVAWDTDGDGAFDDATGATPSFTYDRAYDGLVAVRVTDSGGASSVAYAHVVVTDPNAPPTLSVTPAGLPSATVGRSTTFAAATSDPDGDAVSVAWSVDGANVHTGSTFAYTPTAPGVHVVGAGASDGHGHVVRTLLPVAVSQVDGDEDGWPADVDCDDANALRNPGNVEIPGDGIDNDCSTATGDDFSSPAAGPLPIHGTFLHSSSADRTEAPAIVDLASAVPAIAPGDTITIAFYTPTSFSYYGCGGPFADPHGIGGAAIFSSSPTLLPQSERDRVPDKVAADMPASVSGNTFFGSEPTDIPDDFRLSTTTGTVVQVPQGARYLMLQLSDSYYSDNCGSLVYYIDRVFPSPPGDTHAPTAGDDAFATPESTTLTVGVDALLANDGDEDGDALQVTKLTSDLDAHGTVALDGGSILYTPAAGFVGTASFDYTVSDPSGKTATATVEIDVTPVNAAPTPADDDALVDEGGSLTLPVEALLANDTDPDRDPLTLTAVAPGADTHGTATLAGGAALYVPAAGYAGPASFSYTVADPSGATGTATVHVQVVAPRRPQASPPVASFTHAPGTPAEGAAVELTDTSTAGSAPISQWAWDFGDGGTSSERNPTHVYADDGSYDVTLTVTADDGATDSATQTLRVVNLPPTADAGGPYTAPWGSSIAFGGSAGDPGPADDAQLALSWDFGDGSAPVTGSAAATHAYALPGSYTATLTATDPDGARARSTATVTVTKRPTSTTWDGATSGETTDPATLSATLRDALSQQPLAHEPLSLAVGGLTTSVETGDGGRASASLALDLAPGETTARAAFDGDALYLPSEASTPFTVLRDATALVYTGAASEDFHDEVVLSATLRDPEGGPQPPAGEPITFTVGGQTATALTGADGVARTTLVLDQKAGPLTLGVDFGGDATWAPSHAEAPFAVLREETTLTTSGSTTVPFHGTAHLQAKLLEDGTAPVAGRTVTFAVGGETAAGTTDGSGVAAGDLPLTLDPGSYPVEASFAGDDWYLPAHAAGAALVVVDSPGKVTAGTLKLDAAGRQSGGFVVRYGTGDAAPAGELEYQDHAAGLNVHASAFVGLGIAPDGTSAWFAADATVDGAAGYRLLVYVEDNGEPGRDDVTRLWLTGPNGFAYEAGGTLQGGNVQIH